MLTSERKALLIEGADIIGDLQRPAPTRALDDDSVVRSMLHRDQQFRGALASRDLIGQVKGILMERFGPDAGHALKRLPRTSNTRLAVVACQLVSTDQRPQ